MKRETLAMRMSRILTDVACGASTPVEEPLASEGLRAKPHNTQTDILQTSNGENIQQLSLVV